MNVKLIKKYAWIFSMCLLALWWVLGASATIAWFSDTSDEVTNKFYFGKLDVDVLYKNPAVGIYVPLSGSDQVFDSDARYEPGYTHVTYLQINNTGDVDFQYNVAVTANNATKATNVLGTTFYLPDYLRFGAVFADSETELSRLIAQGVASDRIQTEVDSDGFKVGTWSQDATLEAGKTVYVALVVYMPKEVGNEANYRGEPPTVDLGISILAQQMDATQLDAPLQ